MDARGLPRAPPPLVLNGSPINPNRSPASSEAPMGRGYHLARLCDRFGKPAEAQAERDLHAAYRGA